MKVVDLIVAQPVLKGLIERKMPAKLAYAIAKNFRLITSELEDYDKIRMKLLSDNWILDEKTNKFDVPDEDQLKWKSMHDELLETESSYQPYKVDLAAASQVEWTPSDFVALWFIFDDEGSGELTP